jgi:hypothetical protein
VPDETAASNTSLVGATTEEMAVKEEGQATTFYLQHEKSVNLFQTQLQWRVLFGLATIDMEFRIVENLPRYGFFVVYTGVVPS